MKRGALTRVARTPFDFAQGRLCPRGRPVLYCSPILREVVFSSIHLAKVGNSIQNAGMRA